MLDLIRSERGIDAQTVAVAIADTERRFVHVNPAFEALFGYGADEVVGRPTDIIYATQEGADAVGRDRVWSRTARADSYTIEFRRADGSTFPGMSIAFPVFDAAGTMTAAVGIARDCTREMRRETALRTLYSIAADRTLDPTQKTAAILAFGCDYFGLDKGIVSSIRGDDYTIVHAHDRDGVLEPGLRFELSGTYCRETLRADGPIAFNDIGATMGEHPCYVATRLESYIGAPVHAGTRSFGSINFTSAQPRAEPFTKGDLEMMGMIADWTSDQITIERTLEHLEKARVRAEEANLSKSRFLANMSHEIRTPMTGVLGYADVLLKGDLDPGQRRCAERILGAGRSLLRILNDVLDLSRMEAGKLETVREPLSPEALLDECTELMAPDAEKRGVSLTCEVDDGVPAAVLGDSLRLRQVVLNLLGNALKFTAEGGVSLRCRAADERMVIEVTDTGIGIAPDRIEQVMADFAQADETTQRRYGGTGLGLSISRKLAALMGGRLLIESRVGRGTTVRLTLPLERAAPVEDVTGAVDAPIARRETRVLLVEDVEFNREMFRMMLEGAGHAVGEAHNGRAAIDAVKAAGPGGFDVIVMDVQMPDVDGLTATRMVRQLPGWEDVPVIALSAGAFPDEIAACRDAGMCDHVAKPTTAEILCRAVARSVEARAKDEADSAAATATNAPPPRDGVELPELPDLLPDLPSAARDRLIDQFSAMIGESVGELRALSGVLADEWETPDAAEALRQIASLAHKVKGSAAMMGLDLLADVAADTEAALRAGPDTGAVAELTATLEGTAGQLAELAA